MSLTVKNEGDYTPCPAGNHAAICYAVIDLGTQHQDQFVWEGKSIEASDRPQILIMWEIAGERIEIDGVDKPASISKFYNAFWGERASLRIHLEAWRGRPFTGDEIDAFNVGNLLGKPCMVNVIHTDKGKAKVAGIAAWPKGMTTPTPENEPLLFDLENHDQGTFDKISEGIQNIIKKSPEWQAQNQPVLGFRQTENPVPDDFEDNSSIPF